MASKIRPSAIAGTWYPGHSNELQATIKAYLDRAPEVMLEGIVSGVISPHAGYMYSGLVAAHAYKQLYNHSYETVILLSPMHRYSHGHFIVNNSDYYETPLGLVPIDVEMRNQLGKCVNLSMVKSDEEHALEIQLPFLQTVLKNFKILPIMIGPIQMEESEVLVDALVELSKNLKVLFVISTDLHHIPDYQSVVKRDGEVIDNLKFSNLRELRRTLEKPDCTVCGRIPLYIGLRILDKSGRKNITVLDYKNSGDITGDKEHGQYTVGYVSAVIT